MGVCLLEGAVIDLPGARGLNAAEPLHSLCPESRLIWCSDLDFSLHAYRLGDEYFIDIRMARGV